MGVFYETIPDSLKPWILEQQMLFVGTAPLSPHGHINISPKGGSTFGIPSPTSFWYMDLTGSGGETHAHLHEPGNARIVIMFLAFTGPPRIVRLWGKGRAIENGTSEYAAFIADNKIATKPGCRSIIMLDIDQVATSCGFSVPYYDFVAHRPILDDFFAKKQDKFEKGDEKESMDRYWSWKSQLSIDGLPGMKRGYEFAQRNGVKPLKKMVGRAGEVAERNAGMYGEKERVGMVHLLVVLVLGMVIGAAAVCSFLSPEGLKVLQAKGRLV
ncbi:hypothetical protein HBI51_220440 [Parastagonospora nodorum]|nr:hypothetical protein HBI51_220440 [Parastagonospora nodorum]